MRKPYVTLLHYTAPPIVGGVENVIAQHARLLADAGYPVTVVTGRGGAEGILAGVHVVVVPTLDSEHPENLAIARALETEVPPEFGTLRGSIERMLAPICADSDIVIVHNVLNLHFNLPLTAALHRVLDQGLVRRMVAWCHDISRYVNPCSGVQSRYGFPWDLMRRWRTDITYVAVSSQRQRMLAQTLGGPQDHIRVVPNGVDPTALLGLADLGRRLVEEFNLMDADLIMLMPIRITRAKNIEFALKVTAALKAAGTRPKLIVTGPPDPHAPDSANYFDALLQQRRELDLNGDAIFLYEGTSKTARPLLLNSTTVAELYRVCDLVLMPSHREGFGLPVLEGGLVGKPVFATAIPVLEEIGDESIHLIASGDSPTQVATRIRSWAQQDSTHRLRCRVRKDYTWQSIFARMIEPLIANGDRGREEAG